LQQRRLQFLWLWAWQFSPTIWSASSIPRPVFSKLSQTSPEREAGCKKGEKKEEEEENKLHSQIHTSLTFQLHLSLRLLHHPPCLARLLQL
jgi:hypothetical protein